MAILDTVAPFRPTRTETGARDRGAAWIVSLFAAAVLLQRLSLPGGTVPLLLPVLYGWVAYGLFTGVLAFNSVRLRLWLLAAALTAVVAPIQSSLVPIPIISLTSWGLFVAVWLPATVHLVERGRDTVRRAFEGCVRVGEILAFACIVMMATQFVGLRYQDWLAMLVPKTFLMQGFVITYPVQYDSPIYRANAWIGLEPSIVSIQLGVCLVLAVLLRARARTLLLLAVGLVCTVSGSGIVIFGVALVVMLLQPIRRQIARFFVPGLLVVGLAALTPIGQQMLGRLTEVSSSGSSASLRAITPYRYLWADWTADPLIALVGHGAGSSQKIIEATNVPGLLVASPIKVFFDYGLVAGTALAVFLIACYLDGPTRSLAAGLFLSSWVLQPATTALVIVLPTMLFITWWAPRDFAPVEVEPLVQNSRAEVRTR